MKDVEYRAWCKNSNIMLYNIEKTFEEDFSLVVYDKQKAKDVAEKLKSNDIDIKELGSLKAN